MSENKCPMPGCDGEIIYHGTEFGTDYDSWHGCTKCHFMCDLDHLTRIAAAMEAENRHNALVEAVKKYFKSERLEILKREARAEVDRLIATADCEGDG